MAAPNPEMDGGLDGYDCIPPGAMGKNILTVGACDPVNSFPPQPGDILLDPQSGRGPADDGRIKPDLVAPGNLTSYATPAVSATALLLQEAYYNQNNYYMKSASVRGLLKHTALEAGNAVGPDYNHGWGMVNAYEAGLLIKNNNIKSFIIEDHLDNLDTIRLYFYRDSASTEVKLSLSWTDLKAIPPALTYTPADLNNRTPLLVNDLDVRIIKKSTNFVSYPYKLDPDNPALAATKADNTVDNYERIDAGVLDTGWYEIQITHKDTLDGNLAQEFSLIGSNIQLPQADLNISTPLACSTDTVQLFDNSNFMANHWQWSITPSTIQYVNGTTASSQNPEVVFNAQGAYSVSLVATGNYAQDSTFKDSIINILNSITPSITVIALDSTLCENSMLSFGIQYSKGGTKPQYEWFINGITTGVFDSVYTSTTLQSNDTLTCRLTSSAFCAFPISVTSTPYIVLLDATPVKSNIILGLNKLNIIDQGNIMQWHQNNAAIPGATKSSLTITSNGNYAVLETNPTTLCTAWSDTVTVNNIGLNEHTALTKLNVFPNPVNHQLTINVELNKTQHCRIEIISFMGERLHHQQWADIKQINQLLDVSDYASGLYHLVVSIGDERVVRKIIVQ